MSTARILVVDDEADIRSLMEEILSEEGYAVVSAANAEEARQEWQSARPDLVLLDIWMPDTDGISLLREWLEKDRGHACPVVMMSGHGTVETAVEATRLGAFDFVEKPVSLSKLLRTVEQALESGRAQTRPGRHVGPPVVAPVGRSRRMKDLREQSRRIAAHDTPVLVTGESGTGRETFARHIHSLSPWAAGPFVPLVAGQITDASAEVQLLGRLNSEGKLEPGVLERARGGTLFINELADLGVGAQRLLHGVLEARRFTPVGGREPVSLDSRFISSAPPGFERMSEGDDFRRELLTHLSVVVL
ncbi:MAG: response regulator, partial [Gammaproteobacteria bacterium]